MTLSEMRALLDTRGIQLTKSLGQNFLHDANQLRRIVTAAGLAAGDPVLEIGPGLGPLTEQLLEAGATVLAVEKDERLVTVLRERFAMQGGLQLIHADALAWLKHERRNWADWKVVSNLPYSVASPIMVELAQAECAPAIVVATLQREVVERLAAKAGTEHYGLLTLLVQLHLLPDTWFRIPAGCFFPAPDVESACITLRRRPAPLLQPGEARVFNRLVKLAFSQRRKKMIKLLRAGWPDDALQAAFHKLGLDEQVRAERVALEQFVALVRQLGAAGSKETHERRSV